MVELLLRAVSPEPSLDIEPYVKTPPPSDGEWGWDIC